MSNLSEYARALSGTLHVFVICGTHWFLEMTHSLNSFILIDVSSVGLYKSAQRIWQGRSCRPQAMLQMFQKRHTESMRQAASSPAHFVMTHVSGLLSVGM